MLLKLIAMFLAPSKAKITSKTEQDIQYYLHLLPEPKHTLIWAVGKDTTLETRFGDLEIQSIARKQLKTTQASVEEKVHKLFRGITTLVVYGHDKDSDLYKSLATLGETPPRLVLYKHFEVRLDHSVEVIFLEEKQKPYRSEEENLQKIMTHVAAPLRYESVDIQALSQHLLACFNLLKDTENSPMFYKKTFLEKLCRQIILEKNWDRSSTIERFHVAKACSSSLIKELRLEKTSRYRTLKSHLFEDADYTALTQDEKNHWDYALKEIHANPEKYPIRPGGYHTQIQKVVEARSKRGVPLTVSDITEARKFRKKERLNLKLAAHKMVVILGPTGTGKSETALQWVKDNFGQIREGENLFRITAGEGVGIDECVGTMEVEGDTVVFKNGILTQWVIGKTEGRMLLVDEMTLEKNWDVFNEILNHNQFTVNGVTNLIEGNPVIIVTGNTSDNGKYGGRYPLDKLIVEHGVIMSKPTFSKEELLESIVRPCLDTVITGRDVIEQKIVEVYDALHSTLNISSEEFGVRELRDVSAIIALNRGLMNDTELNLSIFTAFSEVLSQKVNTVEYQKFLKAFALTKVHLSPELVLRRCVLQREALINHNFLGRKQGVILPATPATNHMLNVMLSPTTIIVENNASYEVLERCVNQAYEEGRRLVIQNGSLYSDYILERLLNQVMTEPKPGFGVYLVMDQERIPKQSPALLSRFMAMPKPELGPVVIETDTHEKTCITLDSLHQLYSDPNSIATIFEVITQPFQLPGLLCSTMENYFNGEAQETIKPETSVISKHQQIPTLDSNTIDAPTLPNFDYFNRSEHHIFYNRDQVWTTMDYKHCTGIPYDGNAYVPVSQQRDPQYDESVKTAPNKVPIPLSFDANGFALIPSFTAYQAIQAYATDTGKQVEFYKDTVTGMFAVFAQGPSVPGLLWVTVNHDWGASENEPEPHKDVYCPIDLKTIPTLHREIENLRLGIQDSDRVSVKVEKILGYLHTFTPKLDEKNQGKKGRKLLISLMQTRCGVCRHTAIVGKVLCDYYGILARQVSSNSHTWLEVYNPEDKSWILIETRRSSRLVSRVQDKRDLKNVICSPQSEERNCSYPNLETHPLFKPICVQVVKKASGQGMRVNPDYFLSDDSSLFLEKQLKIKPKKIVLVDKLEHSLPPMTRYVLNELDIKLDYGDILVKNKTLFKKVFAPEDYEIWTLAELKEVQGLVDNDMAILLRSIAQNRSLAEIEPLLTGALQAAVNNKYRKTETFKNSLWKMLAFILNSSVVDETTTSHLLTFAQQNLSNEDLNKFTLSRETILLPEDPVQLEDRSADDIITFAIERLPSNDHAGKMAIFKSAIAMLQELGNETHINTLFIRTLKSVELEVQTIRELVNLHSQIGLPRTMFGDFFKQVLPSLSLGKWLDILGTDSPLIESLPCRETMFISLMQSDYITTDNSWVFFPIAMQQELSKNTQSAIVNFAYCHGKLTWGKGCELGLFSLEKMNEEALLYITCEEYKNAITRHNTKHALSIYNFFISMRFDELGTVEFFDVTDLAIETRGKLLLLKREVREGDKKRLLRVLKSISGTCKGIEEHLAILRITEAQLSRELLECLIIINFENFSQGLYEESFHQEMYLELLKSACNHFEGEDLARVFKKCLKLEKYNTPLHGIIQTMACERLSGENLLSVLRDLNLCI